MFPWQHDPMLNKMQVLFSSVHKLKPLPSTLETLKFFEQKQLHSQCCHCTDLLCRNSSLQLNCLILDLMVLLYTRDQLVHLNLRMFWKQLKTQKLSQLYSIMITQHQGSWKILRSLWLRSLPRCLHIFWFLVLPSLCQKGLLREEQMHNGSNKLTRSCSAY